MTDRDNDRSAFHDGLYKKAISEIGTLRDKLPEEAFASLAREVIRRLSDHPAVHDASVAFPSDAKIDALSRALMQPDPDAGIAFIEKVRAQGASVETVYLAYLAEAAKMLGTWWENDEVTFADVTVATGHIYAVMRGLRPLFRPSETMPTQPTALFTGVPGENHLLGVAMASDLFRKEGWDIALKRDMTHDEIVQYAAQTQPPLIGLSAGGEHALVNLARLVIALRINLPNSSIMVSGAILETAYDSVEAMGIDILAQNLNEALSKAQDIWRQTSAQSQVG